MPGGKAAKRFTSAAEASTRWPVSRQACCRRAACIHGVAEERDLHFNGPEFADGHWSAMQSGAEIGPDAKVTNVGFSALV